MDAEHGGRGRDQYTRMPAPRRPEPRRGGTMPPIAGEAEQHRRRELATRGEAGSFRGVFSALRKKHAATGLPSRHGWRECRIGAAARRRQATSGDSGHRQL